MCQGPPVEDSIQTDQSHGHVGMELGSKAETRDAVLGTEVVLGTQGQCADRGPNVKAVLLGRSLVVQMKKQRVLEENGCIQCQNQRDSTREKPMKMRSNLRIDLCIQLGGGVCLGEPSPYGAGAEALGAVGSRGGTPCRDPFVEKPSYEPQVGHTVPGCLERLERGGTREGGWFPTGN